MHIDKRELVKEVLYLTLILAGASILSNPLLLKGYITGHDSLWHVHWAQQFLSSQESGIFYPQWTPYSNFGCGNATFIFYPPFIFFTYSLLHFFTKEVLVILSASAILAMFSAGVAMYVFSRFYLARWSSILTALVYMAMPYHLLDLYVRSALAEFWAFVWLPIICSFAARAKGTAGPSFLGLSISFAGLVLTHLPTALLFAPFIFMYSAFLLSQEGNWKVFLSRLLALCLGLGLGAFFLIPLILEQQLVDINAITRNPWYWIGNNFLFLGSTGNINFIKRLGHIAVSVLLLAVLSLFFSVFYRNKFEKRRLDMIFFFAVSAILSFFMMISISKPLWEILPLLKRIQFPWRLLTVTSFSVALSVGFAFESLFDSLHSRRRWDDIFAVMLITGLISLNMWHSYTILRSFEGYPFARVGALRKQGLSIRTDSSFEHLLKVHNHYFTGNLWLLDTLEYRPIWSMQKIFAEESSGCEPGAVDDYLGLIRMQLAVSAETDFSAEESVFFERHGTYVYFPPLRLLRCWELGRAIVLPQELMHARIILRRGRATVSIKSWEPETRVIHVAASEPSLMLVRTFYYPRWRAYSKGDSMPVAAEPFTGLIELAMGQGEYDITMRFESGTDVIIGRLMSTVSAVIVLCLALRKPGRQRPQPEFKPAIPGGV